MLRRVDGILRRLEAESRRACGRRPAPAYRTGTGKVWGGTFHATATRLLRLHGQVHRPRALVHHPRPRRRRGPHGRPPHRAGPLQERPPLPAQGHLHGHLQPLRQCPRAGGRGGRDALPLVQGRGRRPPPTLRRLRRPQGRAERPRLRRPAALLARSADRPPRRPLHPRAASTACWSTSIRTPTGCRPRSCRCSAPAARTSPSWATTPRPSTPSGPPPCRNILDFPQQFPDTRVVTLEQNYRSTQPILDATNEVIAGATERHAKNLWSRRAGRRQAPAGLLRRRGRADRVRHPPGARAPRGRAGPHAARRCSSAPPITAWRWSWSSTRRNIPFHKYGGLRFVETAHVKDLMAFLRLAENPRDLMAGTRVLMLLPGVGPKKATALMDLLAIGLPDARLRTRRRRAARDCTRSAAAREAPARRRGASAPAAVPCPSGPGPAAPAPASPPGRPPRALDGGGRQVARTGVAHDRHRESRAGRSRLPDQADQALLRPASGTSLRQRPRPPHGPGAARMAGRPLPRPSPLPGRDRPRPAQPTPRTWPGPRCSTRTSSSSAPSTRPRGWSGTRST